MLLWTFGSNSILIQIDRHCPRLVIVVLSDANFGTISCDDESRILRPDSIKGLSLFWYKSIHRRNTAPHGTLSADPFSPLLPAQWVGVWPHFQLPWRLSSMFPKSELNFNENSFPGMAHRTVVSIRPVASGCRSSWRRGWLLHNWQQFCKVTQGNPMSSCWLHQAKLLGISYKTF